MTALNFTNKSFDQALAKIKNKLFSDKTIASVGLTNERASIPLCDGGIVELSYDVGELYQLNIEHLGGKKFYVGLNFKERVMGFVEIFGARPDFDELDFVVREFLNLREEHELYQNASYDFDTKDRGKFIPAIEKKLMKGLKD